MSKSNYFNLKVSKLQINYRYDNTKKSEVNMKMIAVSPNKTITYLFMGKHKLIYDYPKDDIGKEITINTFLFTSYAYWSGSEEFFFNIYERDWYASNKLILKSYSNYLGHYIYLYGKMNHSTDWYYICPTSPNYPKKFYDYADNSSIIYSTSKSKLILYKYN